jgi:hypothetical protein
MTRKIEPRKVVCLRCTADITRTNHVLGCAVTRVELDGAALLRIQARLKNLPERIIR